MKVRWIVLAMACVPAAAAAKGGSVVGSKHDFSVTGPGPIKAETETQVCVFCHQSHGGDPRALGARPEIGNSHRPYESTTLRGRANAPSGASRVCLSCHDGTIAVGQTRKRNIRMNAATAGGRIPAGRRSNLGTDLRSTHPVSIVPAGDHKVRPPAHGRVKLDHGGQVQCTSCHDPHSEFGGSVEGRFLVSPTLGSQLCTECHEGAQGSHATSSRRLAASSPGAATTVADAGCGACHRSHGAPPGGRLVARRESEGDDAVCLACHAGGAAARADVGRDVVKPWTHAVDGGRAHDRSEGPDTSGRRLPETSAAASRHAVCVDCHEPHLATDTRAQAPYASGPLAGVWGIDAAGRRVEPARFEYEICFKCHGDSANKPPPGRSGLAPSRRKVEDRNLRRVFDPSAVSSHPVVASVRGGDVPSLAARYAPGALIYCTDCHASNDGAGAGGTGARGPHGSVYAPLLERNYSTASPTVESPFTYALCYKCHDREVLLSDRSAFRLHRKHVVDEQAPCASCHTAHGISAAAGNPRQNSHLIDFDLSVVRPVRGREPEYERRGARTGSCTLTCHGEAHDAWAY